MGDGQGGEINIELLSGVFRERRFLFPVAVRGRNRFCKQNQAGKNHGENGKLELKLPSGHFFFYTHLLSSFWTSREHMFRPFSPSVFAFNFYRAQGSAIPLLVDFSLSVANSRFRAFRKSISAQEKSPPIYTSMHSGGFELT